jgi:hypothetical protein
MWRRVRGRKDRKRFDETFNRELGARYQALPSRRRRWVIVGCVLAAAGLVTTLGWLLLLGAVIAVAGLLARPPLEDDVDLTGNPDDAGADDGQAGVDLYAMIADQLDGVAGLPVRMEMIDHAQPGMPFGVDGVLHSGVVDTRPELEDEVLFFQVGSNQEVGFWLDRAAFARYEATADVADDGALVLNGDRVTGVTVRLYVQAAVVE